MVAVQKWHMIVLANNSNDVDDDDDNNNNNNCNTHKLCALFTVED